MVYERIPVRIYERTDNYNYLETARSIAFIMACTSVSILVTCRLIHAEAAAIMSDKLNTILRTPVRVITGISHIYYLLDEIWFPFFGLAIYVQTVKESVNEEARPESADADYYGGPGDLEKARAKALSNYPRKWLLQIEKQYQLLDLEDVPRVEVGIYYYKHSRDEERFDHQDLDTHALNSFQYHQENHVLHLRYRLIEDQIPAALRQELKGRSISDSDPLDSGMPQTGPLIDSKEHMNEWCADYGLSFPSSLEHQIRLIRQWESGRVDAILTLSYFRSLGL
jgi:hypothetical protein